MVRNESVVSFREDRLREYKILGQLLSRPLVSVSTHVGVPELKNLQLVELLEKGDLAIDHVPSTFVDVLLLAHEVRDIILVLSDSYESSLSEHNLTRESFALVPSFFENKARVFGIRINL
jgi:hypothetical protein